MTAKLFSLARNAAAPIAVGVLLADCLVPETIDARAKHRRRALVAEIEYRA